MANPIWVTPVRGEAPNIPVIARRHPHQNERANHLAICRDVPAALAGMHRNPRGKRNDETLRHTNRGSLYREENKKNENGPDYTGALDMAAFHTGWPAGSKNLEKDWDRQLTRQDVLMTRWRLLCRRLVTLTAPTSINISMR